MVCRIGRRRVRIGLTSESTASASGEERGENAMKIMLIGSSGMIGSRIMNEALSRGHKVTSLVRDTTKTGEYKTNLEYVVGDIFNAESLAEAAVDHDAVISAYGPGTGDASLIVKAAHSIVEGLTRVEPIRLIDINGAGSLEVSPGLQLVDAPGFPEQWKGLALAHRDALEVFRKAGFAGFDWTAVSPSAIIEPGNRTGHFRLGTEQLLKDEKGDSRISAEDFAMAILDEIEKPKHKQQRFTVGY
jgi:putative NADH-flavin reductase